MVSTRTYNFFVIIFCLVITIGSSIPGNSVPELYIFGMDKLLHVLEYFILGHLLVNSLSDKTHYPVYLSFVLGLCFALIDETYQLTVIERSSSSFDVIADAIGLTLAIIINHKFSKIIG